MRNRILVLPLCLLICLISCSKLKDDHATGNQYKCGMCHEVPKTDSFHIKHVGIKKYDCSACHKGHSFDSMYTSQLHHINGDTDVIFSDYFNASGAGSFDKSARVCNNVYCHGYISQGTSTSVSMDEEINGQCGKCHNIESILDSHHTVTDIHTIENCSYCHDGYSLKDSIVFGSTHVDGAVQSQK